MRGYESSHTSYAQTTVNQAMIAIELIKAFFVEWWWIFATAALVGIALYDFVKIESINDGHKND